MSPMLPMLPMLPGRTHALASFIPRAQLIMREAEDEAEQLFYLHNCFYICIWDYNCFFMEVLYLYFRGGLL